MRDYLQKNGRVEVKQAVRWAVELCDVLSYLHSRGQAVIYRDLKPENIMIRPDGTVKLVDFGAAMQETGTRHGQYWQAGTLGYCPGDQWKGAKGIRHGTFMHFARYSMKCLQGKILWNMGVYACLSGI